MKATETVKIDGRIYNPGDEIPDLGNWEQVEGGGYQGFSNEVDKLPHYAPAGTTAMCLDTNTMYTYHQKTDTWIKR